ncbi:uncharacterized protein LOC127858347 [Dreissena polymorpha]|uniref:uncharacterized protein LOC127858347 n=1 Tax=Dreissena polymorpha TaxID=45954 RepID=UPI0022640D64|nr:uncharacterized protein LOC127858347 [Dreissena polymorpha]
MARRYDAILDNDSDELLYWCSQCKERSLEIEADYYCKKCHTFYCGTCTDHHSHGGWFNKKYLYGKHKIHKWPVSKKMEDILLKCEVHEDENLTAFCNEHDQLCCSICVTLCHRPCTTVTVKSKAAKIKSKDLNELQVQVLKNLTKMNQLQTHQQNSIESLNVTYDQLVSSLVADMRLNINSYLCECENSIMNGEHENEQHTVHEIRQKISFILSAFENGIVKAKTYEKTIKQVDFMDVVNTCKRHQTELFRLNEALNKNQTSPELSFILRYKSRHNIQKYETFLKDNFPNHELNVRTICTQSLNIEQSTADTRFKTAVCVLPNGHIFVAERDKRSVTLLNQTYDPVSHLDIFTYPWDICLITPNEVAVTLDDGNTHVVQFITVHNRRLVIDRTLPLQHQCRGIDHHQGTLFVTSGTALYKYSMTGKLISKLYEDTSVCCCAVCPTGDKVYVTNWDQHKLLTLGMDGSCLACFTDPELEYPGGVHVLPAGQVLVCGWGSHNIIQVDNEGRKKLANFNSGFMRYPWSVYYNKITSSIIVGGDEWNRITFFELL